MNEPREEQCRTTSTDSISRIGSEFPDNDSITHSTEGNSIIYSGTIFPIRQADRVGAVSEIIGDDISGNKGSASGVAQSTTTTVVDQQISTPPQITQAGETEGHTEMYSGLAPLVEQKEIGPRGPSGEHTSKEDGGDNGCVSDWLGGCLARQNSERLMGVPLEHGTYQCVRVEGSLHGLETTDCFSVRQACSGKNRQHVSSLSYQSSGRHQIIAFPPGVQEASVLGPSKTRLNQGNLHTGSSEPGCQSPLSNRASPRGMALASRGGRSDMGQVWESSYRSVCIRRDNSLQDVVCDEQPRWTFGSGCTVSRVAGRIVICFSPLAINSSCAQACGTGALQGRIDCTKMANETLVSASFTSSTRPSLAVTNQSRPSHSGGGSDLAPESSHVTTLGLASAQSISHKLEEAVAKTINNAKAPSTWENYSSRWRVFSKWCQDRNIDPAGCGLEFILCFLQSLLDSGRKVNTVRVYVAAISHFHNVVEGLSTGKHALVSQFLKGARRLHPERKLRSPSWDLPLVLQSLTEAPFEPLAQADLRSLSWKTVFLLAISSAKRVSELHALSVSDDCLRWKTD